MEWVLTIIVFLGAMVLIPVLGNKAFNSKANQKAMEREAEL